MNWKKILIGGGLAAAAPFTGGTSLAFLGPALAAGGVGTALGGAFDGGGGTGKKNAGTDDVLAPFLRDLQSSSAGMRAQGEALRGLGDDALRPVVDYFNKLLGGDEQALLDATRPERSRVIDQYDTARRAISEFSGRGGGANAAMAQSRFDQAGVLSNLTATARRDAAGQAGNLGTALQGLGLSAQQLASGDLQTILNAILTQSGLDITKSGQNKQLAGGIAEGLGTLLGLYLTRDGGTWGKQP